MTRHSFLFHIVRGAIVGFTGGLALGQALIFVMAALASDQSNASRTDEGVARLSHEHRAESLEAAANDRPQPHPTVSISGRQAERRHRAARFAP